MACKECYGDITITHHGRGFGQFAVWKCNDCQSRYVTKHCKVGTQYAPDLSTVYTSLINDDGYNGYQRYCGALHMPSMCKAVYYQHTQSLYKKMHDHYNELITIIHDRIRRYYREKLGVTPEDSILALEVSFDGSYAKRGYKSQYCLGIVIEVYTGWIVDFSVMSKCRLCKDTGLVECPHGEHIGSSGSMEPKIAKILWDRSRTIGFEYKVMVADGDSATYMIIKDTYGPISVVKKDCINHVGKRMTSRLMTLRDSYTENVRTKSGMNKGLTRKTYPLRAHLKDFQIKKISDYYKGAIHRSIGEGVGVIRNNIFATYHHHSAFPFCSDNHLHHRLCPEGEGSWCPYQKALAEKRDPNQFQKKRGLFSRMSSKGRAEVLKIYEALTNETLLLKCQKGHTQNINKSLHSKLWSKVQKHKYHGKSRLLFLAQTTALDHNWGYEKASLLNRLGVGTSEEYLSVLRQQDSERSRHSLQKSKKRQEPKDAGPHYRSGLHM